MYRQSVLRQTKTPREKKNVVRERQRRHTNQSRRAKNTVAKEEVNNIAEYRAKNNDLRKIIMRVGFHKALSRPSNRNFSRGTRHMLSKGRGEACEEGVVRAWRTVPPEQPETWGSEREHRRRHSSPLRASVSPHTLREAVERDTYPPVCPPAAYRLCLHESQA